MKRRFQGTLDRAKRVTPPTPKRLDGKQGARVIAARLGPPPKGCANWSLRLFARKLIELKIVDSMSRETVRRTLQKNGMTNRKIEYWVIPPEADVEFVGNMGPVIPPVLEHQFEWSYPSHLT